MEPRIQYAKTSDGVNLAYSTLGEGPPLVVMMSPIASHAQLRWEVNSQVFEPLAKSFRLFGYDPPGTGLSDRDRFDYDLEAMARDLDAAVVQAGLDLFALVASNDAVPVAVKFAAGHPDRVSHLVLLNGWSSFSDIATSPTWKAQEALADQDWTLYTETMARVFARLDDPQLIEGMGEYYRACIEPEAWRALTVAIQSWDVAHLLPTLTAETLVLNTNDDSWAPARVGQKLAAGIPNARFLPIDDVYTRLLPLVVEFLGVVEKDSAAPAAEGGFATILFTDIASSTSLAQQLGDAKTQEVRHAHNDIVRAALTANTGSEIKHTGDGIMASFSTASSALDAAIAIQRGVAKHKDQHPDSPLAVYVGLNAGEPISEEDDLFGTSVDLARRICDHAQPGRILASDVIRQLAAGKDFLFSDLGETELRGFEDPVKLWELRWREQS